MPQATLQVACSGSRTCIWISADMKAADHNRKTISCRPMAPSPVVIRQLFPSPNAFLGEDDHMIVQQARRCAAHCDCAAVGVGLTAVVQQVRHVACIWREQLGARHEHLAAASLAVRWPVRGRSYLQCRTQERLGRVEQQKDPRRRATCSGSGRHSKGQAWAPCRSKSCCVAHSSYYATPSISTMQVYIIGMSMADASI